MGIFDVILLIIIVGFGLFGLWFGFVHTLGSLFGTLLGAFVAGRWYEAAGTWLVGITGWNEHIARVLLFGIIFFVANRLVGLAFFMIEHWLGIVVRFPFLAGINRLLGLVLGVFEGLITVGIVLYVIGQIPFSDAVVQTIEASRVAPIAVQTSAFLLLFLPEGLKNVHESI